MNIWMEHVKAVRKKCPNLSFKDALKEAKKTYNKNSKTVSKKEIVCKKTQPRRPKKSRKRTKKRKMTRGRSRGRSKSRKLKVSKKARCGVFKTGPGC